MPKLTDDNGVPTKAALDMMHDAMDEAAARREPETMDELIEVLDEASASEADAAVFRAEWLQGPGRQPFQAIPAPCTCSLPGLQDPPSVASCPSLAG